MLLCARASLPCSDFGGRGAGRGAVGGGGSGSRRAERFTSIHDERCWPAHAVPPCSVLAIMAGAASAQAASVLASTHQFMSDFFPSWLALMEAHTPTLWARLQPPALAERCAEHSLALSLPGGAQLTLRNPTLLPFQLLGMWVGLAGTARLRRLQPARQRRQHAYLQRALVFFAAMNATSIICHVIFPRKSVPWLASKVLDVAFTGASSACVLLQVLAPAPHTAAEAATRAAHALVLALSVEAAGELLQLAWVPEAVYLGTTLLATVATAYSVLLPAMLALARGSGSGIANRTRGSAAAAAAAGAVRRQQAQALVAAVAGAALIIASLPADAWLCESLGSSVFGTTVHLLFLGCDLAFLGLLLLACAGNAQGAKPGTNGGGGRAMPHK